MEGWLRDVMKFAGYTNSIQVTRGGILIELGKYEAGKQILVPLTETGNHPIDIAISCYYLAKADHNLGNKEQALVWLKQAEMIGKKIPGLSEMFGSIKQELWPKKHH
jgi:hypothetical protein